MEQALRKEIRLVTATCVVLSCLVSVAAALSFHRTDAHRSVYFLANLVGDTTYSLLHGHGMTAFTDAQGSAAPILYRAARMPVATLTVAAGALVFGEHSLRSVAVLKTMLFLVPVWVAMALALRWPGTKVQRILRACLLLLPFAALPFLADVVNLQVEEGYSYALLACAFALLLSVSAEPPPSHLVSRFIVPFALTVDLLYLSKSSMLPAVLLLTFFAVSRVRPLPHAALLLLLVLAAPLGWAVHQRAVSGRASMGTSLDGLNLHKGENPLFLQRYPPPPGSSLDMYDPELSGSRAFASEWDFNDYHQHAALEYMRHSPGDVVRGCLRKAYVFLFSLRKTGSAEPSSRGMDLLETFGILILRLALWAAMLRSFVCLFQSPRERFPALLFLLLAAACAVPYLAGFAYTRHVSVLLYPSILLLCRFAAPVETARGV